ncbi:HDOD domain-containing protein [Candidatus Berkiella aquae]|uniref:HDOD domain protein n=1 Tax=Candidatus Berkiella aquae TaxID=295108 RepID=A0A0Q9YIY3_9GAMM|nr:HDOD domain-containing protein [Candidatus Berkiella aquae]MCS5710767.1 HDOD domain-containing protein [Candidatus Berkiella aquae]
MQGNEQHNASYQKIFQSIKDNKIQLPSQPSIFVTLQKLSNDPDVTTNKLCQVIGQDPALTVRILSIANSPIMRGSVSIASLEAAINRLGVRFVTYVSMGLALKQLFIAQHKPIEERVQLVWDQSSKVAASAYVLAKALRLFPPEEVMLAGLVHEIGKLPILTFADQSAEYFNNLPLLDATINNLHPPLGKAILKLWKFPDEIACVPENVANPNHKTTKPMISDIIQVAKQHILNYARPDNLPESNEPKSPSYYRLEIDQLLDSIAVKNMKKELTSYHQLFT